MALTPLKQKVRMSKTLRLKAINTVNSASRKLTLLQIVELLEKCEITPRGNLTNTPKKTLLINSLKSADVTSVEKFIKEINEDIPTKKNSPELLIDLHGGFKSSKVERFINSGDFEEAVRVAFVRINNRVKKLSLLTIDGAPLMRTAFSKKAPKLKINSLKTREEQSEQEGIMHIFEGSMLAFRNPQSHDDEKKMTFEEASRILSLANYLMTTLDNI